MTVRKWVNVCFFNLMLVALMGLLIRYKLSYPFPYFNLKYLLHGHSHFAITGWITQVLMVLVSASISSKISAEHFNKYQSVLWANYATSLGMLFSFPFQGYGPIAIAFSSLSLIVSFIFSYKIWWDISKLSKLHKQLKWFRASVVFLCVSTVGIIWMVYLMITKSTDLDQQMSAVHFFLHLQYSGWFIFACIGLFIEKYAERYSIDSYETFYFWIMAILCIPSYLLTAPWMAYPKSLQWVLGIIAVILPISWLIFIKKYFLSVDLHRMLDIYPVLRWLGLTSLVALTLKYSIQMVAMIPSISQVTFHNRNMLVAYLHLVFLGIVSCFILAYTFKYIHKKPGPSALIGLAVFLLGIVINEGLLFLQGLLNINNQSIPYNNSLLFLATSVICLGSILIFLGSLNRHNIK